MGLLKRQLDSFLSARKWEGERAMCYLLVRMALFSGITIMSAVVLAVPYLTIK
jgi:hypothetical protein